MPDLGVGLPSALQEALLGDGLYKLGYVVADREAAVTELEQRYGFAPFARFEPAFPATLPDGRTVDTSLRCAFSSGHGHVLEVLEPLSGAHELWSDALEGPGPAFRFHHIGAVTDDLAGVMEAARRHGLPRVLHAEVPGRFAFAYHELPGFGHLVEHIQYFGDAGGFLDGVRAPRAAAS
jgi:hypothetical protein